MDKQFVFYDYIDADNTGNNVIKDWLDNEGKPAAAHFDLVINHLEHTPPGSGSWGDPYIEIMENKRHRNWKGFIALRKKRDVYRIIGKREGRNVFLVATAMEKGKQRYETSVSLATAENRVDQMKTNPTKYRRPHE